MNRALPLSLAALSGGAALALMSAFAQGDAATPAAAEGAKDDGFRQIFDGKSLEGWDGNPDFWRVEDGAITGQTTAEKPTNGNTFITWTEGTVDDFELKAEFKIDGGNSGIQFRSFSLKSDTEEANWRIGGYQADFEAGDTWSGTCYGEAFRGILAKRGESATIGADGKPQVTGSVGDTNELNTKINKGDWNEYHIIAKGNKITQKINGTVMSTLVDEDPNRRLDGLLSFQLHAGPPMKVQFRNVRLKRTKLDDGRKKVVFVSGNPSHGWGAHEHYAGNVLLAKRLNKAMPDKIHAVVYKGGWPSDPTALQNADAIIIFCTGGGAHLALRHLEQLDQILANGVGYGTIHYGVEIPKGPGGDAFLKWQGGYFETHWSVNPHWEAEFNKFPDHPVASGVEPFKVNDEWYYHMRFRDGMKGVTPILSALPPEETLKRPDGPHSGNPEVRAAVLERSEPQHVCWVSERDDGGRGFGFTGAHFHKNWADDSFRKTVLNAVTWIAGAEVPEGGVPSETPSEEELNANQDERRPGAQPDAEQKSKPINGQKP